MANTPAGDAAGTAAWVTNVGNEHGQVLMSVLTESEGDGLLPMADGLMRRYSAAGKAPSRVLYVDRDYCSVAGRCKTAQMFGEWDQLVVRQDVWHLMRHFDQGRHHRHSPAWDAEDVTCLQEARQSPLDPTSRELSRHGRRRTRGAEETERLIQELLESMWDVTDGMGVPLIDPQMMEDIWSTQRRHLRCIQDPPGVLLYAKTGEFIPGTSANALHFQVYLLEGLVRWNEDCARAAVAGGAKLSFFLVIQEDTEWQGNCPSTWNEVLAREGTRRKTSIDSWTRLTNQLIQWRRMLSGVSRLSQKYMAKMLRALYEATSTECQTYVRWLRTQQVNVGSRMHTVQVFILGWDKEGSAAGPSAAAPPPAAPPAQQRAWQPASSKACLTSSLLP
ncbi:unnamed protein product [Pleuronectes platessa]|uniref:Uncharacterized protein n=1 Tax=Pleuronectes platessa TaxID=8262 RepID=A0A9N7USQ5_PLEPL|nr:unnamed protein product [Pleuronectes platessa]